MLDVRFNRSGPRGRSWPLLAALALGCGGPDLDGDGDPDERDCDPKNAAVHEGATEICNGTDDDCDGFTDEEVSTVAFQDRDGDGAGDPDRVSRVCAMPADGVLVGGDCDDKDPGVAPGLPELCDGIDQDCDGAVDEDAGRSWFTDADGDGHGTGDAIAGGCTAGAGQAFRGGDCDDASDAVYPGADEMCDAVDNDCDGTTDEGASSVRIWEDRDGDGYGDPDLPAVGCATDAGYAPNALDCDDSDPLRSPDAEDLQGDGEDQDCDGYVDEYGVPVPFATVFDALQAAPDGSVVQLDAGTFVTTVDLTGRDITFAGEGCDRTTLYADGQGTALTMDRGRVEGLTITAGTGTFDGTDADGGGLWVSGDVTGERVCIVGNSVSGQGGGAAVIAGTLTLRDSVLDRNSSVGNGGGVNVAAGAALVLERTSVTGNAASKGSGAGVAASGGELVATNTVFAGNAAYDDGGGVFLGVSTDTSVNPVTYGRSSAVLDHCTFYGNTLGASTEPRGQAIYNRASDLVVTSTGFAGHPGTSEVVEDHDIGDTDDGNYQAPLWTRSEVAFFGNAAFDYDFTYLHDVLHAPPDFVLVDPALPPGMWDLRLLPGSAWIDAGSPAETDPDGTRSDIGAFGGPGAPPGALASYAGDEDGDGLPDGWEIHAGLDPLVDDATSDADGDGLDAAAELAFDSAPDAADTDLDGVDDGDEEALGTLPRDPSDHAPFPDAGRDRFGLVGEAVTADGSGSWDPDLDGLTFAWSVDGPPGSGVVAVDDPTSPFATFTPDVGGTWTLTLTVDDGGTTRSDTVAVEVLDGFVVPDDFPTIQAAIDASADGDDVAVRPGVYTENLAFGEKDLTLAGLGDAPGDVVVDGGGADRVLTLEKLHTSTLGNLTLRNGSATLGGGIYAVDHTLTLSEVTLEDNVALDNGGGAYFSGGDLVATGLRVTGNRATAGGGLFAISADVTVTDALFAWNSAIAPGGEGGALYLDNGLPNVNVFLTFRNVVFQENTGLVGSAVGSYPNLITRIEISQSAFVGHSGALSTLYVTDGTIQLLDDVWLADDDRTALVAGGSSGEWVVLGGVMWDTPQAFEPGIVTWPTPLWEVAPEFGWYTPDGTLDDVFAPRPGSPLVDAGLLLFSDPDGSRADIGPAGGPWAPRELRRWTRDDDLDGMSDGWEVRFGLDPLADDAGNDPDADGRTNAQEYAASTDPLAP